MPERMLFLGLRPVLSFGASKRLTVGSLFADRLAREFSAVASGSTPHAGIFRASSKSVPLSAESA